MAHVDHGAVSRRTLLAGGAASVAVLAGLGIGADYEINRHPSLHQRLFGCGRTPPIPSSSYRVTTATMPSAAMKADLPWTVAVPADHSPGQPLPVVLCLPGDGGRNQTLTNSVGLPGWATAAGLRFGFACPGGEASTYYHPRKDGTDSFTWVTEEFLPMAERRFGMGGGKASRAVFGWSMGGYGALSVAQRRPDLVNVAVASSPAVFPTYSAAVTGHSATFDSAADWERWGFWNQAGEVHDVAVRLDCGTGDPFVSTARQLLHRIPGAVGTIADGCHDNGFWRRTATSQLHFVAAHVNT
jgi:pimeloyl-ACP methyl ester carboxylesterase